MRIYPPILLLILIGLIVAVDRYVPLSHFSATWLYWTGGVIMIMGIGLTLAAKRQIRRAGANIDTFGEPGQMLTEGLFGISRNPVYLGMILVSIGAALISGALSAWILSAAFMVIVRYWYIAFEEDAMRRKHGDRYDVYCDQVRRWIGCRRSSD